MLCQDQQSSGKTTATQMKITVVLNAKESLFFRKAFHLTSLP